MGPRAITAGTVHPGTTVGDVMALIWAMRGLVQATGEVGAGAWQRFLDIHLAGLRSAGPRGSNRSARPGRPGPRTARPGAPGAELR